MLVIHCTIAHPVFQSHLSIQHWQSFQEAPVEIPAGSFHLWKRGAKLSSEYFHHSLQTKLQCMAYLRVSNYRTSSQVACLIRNIQNMQLEYFYFVCFKLELRKASNKFKTQLRLCMTQVGRAQVSCNRDYQTHRLVEVGCLRYPGASTIGSQPLD